MSTRVSEAVVDEGIERVRHGELPQHFYVGTPGTWSDLRRGEAARQGAPCQRSGCSLPASDPIHLRPA